MISRRYTLEKHSSDELDALIQRVLREEVAGASPSPRVWRHIHALAGQQAIQTRMWGKGLEICCVVLTHLSEAAFPVRSTYWSQNEWGDRKYKFDFTYLFDQYGFMLKLAF